ncbi:MAG: MFS transporter [bacterium]|nr:MFS transporter [bacterium]
MPHLRWWIAALLFLATVINYVDRQTLSVLAPVLRDEFGMSNTDYSRIVSAFLLAYLIMQAGSGRLMDWLGTRRGFSLCIIWWSAAAMLHAGARSAMQFGFFRFLLGLGEAGNWPGAVKAISEWFPARERAFAIGFFNSGSTLGAVIAPPLVAWLALQYGWRNAFLLTGSLGFVWLILWLLIYQHPAKHRWLRPSELELIQSGQEKTTAADKIRWRELFGYRQVWGLVLGRMLADPVWWFYVFWLPEYLKREREFSLAMIGYFAWIPFLAADLGCLTGGWLSGHLVKRGMDTVRARKTVMLFSVLLMTSGIPAVLTENANLAIALISLATFSFSNYASNVLTLPADLFPQRIVASVSGLSGTGAATGGLIFTLIIGAVVDRFSYLPVFIAAGTLPLIAFGFIVWLVRARPSGSSAFCDQ